MGVSAQGYAQQLGSLLPRGDLWRGLRRAPVFGGLLNAIADGLARFHARAEQLRMEADPRFTTALLEEWERSVGLPDGCIPGGGSTQQRRDAVVAKLNSTGGCSLDYYRGIAAELGHPDAVVENIGTHQFRITVPGVAVRVMTCNDTCNDALRSWGGAPLVCAIERVKHAHVVAHFSFGD